MQALALQCEHARLGVRIRGINLHLDRLRVQILLESVLGKHVHGGMPHGLIELGRPGRLNNVVPQYDLLLQ